MRSEKLPPETLKQLFEASFGRWREHPAFSNLGVTLCYGEVERLSAAFGVFLRSGLGLGAGERVAIILPTDRAVPAEVIVSCRF